MADDIILLDGFVRDVVSKVFEIIAAIEIYCHGCL